MSSKPRKKRGPKGGIKHQPGRGHDRKSQPQLKKRYAKKQARLQRARQELAQEQWRVWDNLPDDVKKLRNDLLPDLPRPSHED
jgi:type II secretory pathway component PulJ